MMGTLINALLSAMMSVFMGTLMTKDGHLLSSGAHLAADQKCCCCDCGLCLCDAEGNHEVPTRWKVVIAGVANGGGCTDCGSFNCIYYLDQVAVCTWEIILDPPVCFPGTVQTLGMIINGGTMTVYVRDQVLGISPFRKVFNELQHCLTLTDIDVPKVANENRFPSGPFDWCDWTNATCTVSAA